MATEVVDKLEGEGLEAVWMVLLDASEKPVSVLGLARFEGFGFANREALMLSSSSSTGSFSSLMPVADVVVPKVNARRKRPLSPLLCRSVASSRIIAARSASSLDMRFSEVGTGKAVVPWERGDGRAGRGTVEVAEDVEGVEA